jgi:prepilin-type N-terminal cleavage/methylation domain-containing protein
VTSLRRDAGLTLVELMITLVVASLVAASTFAFFAGQQTIYETQGKLLTVQQNLWSSMDLVSRYVRAAGTGMLNCVRPDSDAAGSDTGDPPPVGATMPQTGLRVFRSVATPATLVQPLIPAGAMRLAPLWIKNGAAGAPDSLTVVYGAGASGASMDANLATTIPINASSTGVITTLAGQAARFLTNEFILLVDRAQANGDRACTLFQITGISGNILQHATTSVWNASSDLAALIPFAIEGGATVTATTGGVRSFGQLTWVQFAIDSTGAPDVPPRLTMNRLDGTGGPEVVADGIEDMQIAYACDLAPVGAPDGVLTEGTDAATRATDEWTYNQDLDATSGWSGEAAQTGCLRPDSIRITLTARSLNEDNLIKTMSGNAKPAAEDGVAGSTDRYRHRVATVSMHPWN